jgi:phospholipase C
VEHLLGESRWQLRNRQQHLLQHLRLLSVLDLDHDKCVQPGEFAGHLRALQSDPDRQLPAVSYVKPDGWLDGHPSSSKLDLFEGFVKKIADGVQRNKRLWASTAIIVTFDEDGGYYDSGYVQPLEYFGAGTRIPALVISPYTTPGHISHVYADHVSILKFIEANWGLVPLTARSRDNFPNPITGSNPYVPLNTPAIGDLMDLFNFPASKK